MLDNESNGPLIYLRYALPRTKEFLQDIKQIYDGIVVPANILLYQYKSTPAIMYYLKKPFFIDPMSYLFAQPFEKFKKKLEMGSKFKPSFIKLVEGYGFDSNEFMDKDKNSLISILKKREKSLYSFIDSSLDFQKNRIDETLKKSKDFLNEDFGVNNITPKIVIPPYFLYCDDEDVRNLNYEILDYCKKNKNSNELFPMIFIDKDNLNNSFIDDVVSKISIEAYPGFCIWIDNFDERFAEVDQIKSFIYLIKKLSQKNTKEVVVLYGGFFNLLLNKFGISCVCHGLAYSESREINASISEVSGPAPVRYYIRDLHQFLTLENALKLLRKRPDLICDCPICQRVIQNNPENVTKYQSEEMLAMMHFLYNRYQEKKMIANLEIHDIVKYLAYIIDFNQDITLITKGSEEKPIIDPSLYENWKNAIESSIG